MKNKLQNNYKRASAYYMIGTLFNKGMSFLTVPIFTRVLSTSDYGIINTYNSWIAIVAMIIGLAMHMGIRSAFVDYYEKIDSINSVTSTFVLLHGLALCPLILMLICILKINISYGLVLLCVFQSIAAALVENYTMFLMMKLRYKFRTLLMVLPNLISVILSLITILYILEADFYMGRIIPTAAVSIFFGLLVLILVYQKNNILFNQSYLKYILAISLPLVLHGIALNVLSQSDRTMIIWLVDSSKSGIYSVVYNLGMISLVITAALDGIWIPWFIDKMKKRDYLSINVVAKDYVNLISDIMVALMLVGPEILKILAAKEYWEGIIIIPPIVLSNFIVYLYTLYVNVEHYHKKTLAITLNTIIAALANVVLNLLLIPIFGYTAAAYTTLASYIISLFLHFLRAKKLNKELLCFACFKSSIMHIVLTVLIFYLLLDKMLIRWAIVIVYMLIMAIMKRNRIRLYLKKQTNLGEK
jgi:O-antigen/teichoic acid export membrane protein